MSMIFDSGSGLEKVVSVEHIRQLAHDRRSCCIFYRILPASFLLNMPASLLLRAIDSGSIHIYPKSETRPKKPLRLKKRRGKKAIPDWCFIGKVVYWKRSKQNHVITGIRDGRIFFTPGNDFEESVEWAILSRLYEFLPVELIETKGGENEIYG